MWFGDVRSVLGMVAPDDITCLRLKDLGVMKFRGENNHRVSSSIKGWITSVAVPWSVFCVAARMVWCDDTTADIRSSYSSFGWHATIHTPSDNVLPTTWSHDTRRHTGLQVPSGA